MAYNDEFFGPLEEIFNSAKKDVKSEKSDDRSLNTVSGMNGVNTNPRISSNGQVRSLSQKPVGVHSYSSSQVRGDLHRNVSSKIASATRYNYRVDRRFKTDSSVKVIKRKKNSLIIRIAALAIAGTVAAVGFSNLFKSSTGKQIPDDTSKVSAPVDVDASNINNDSLSDLSDNSNFIDTSNDIDYDLKRQFSSNSDNMDKCDEFKQTDFGKYVNDVCVRYGQDYDLLVAQFYHESHLEHYDVLPVYYSVDNSPVSNDNGQNWFNGTGYGMAQLTVDGSDVDARVVATDELVVLTNNEENASDPYTNVELGVMLWQDNQFRTFYLILENYNKAIGINECFTYDNIKRILNGESVGLPVPDEKHCVNQIMSALGYASLDNYNHGLGNFENYILPGIFDENGNFLYDKYRQNIYDFCSTHDNSGDPNYIDNVMANFKNDEFRFYVNKLDGFATFSICKNPSECFVKFEPKEIVYSYEDEQVKMR